MTWVYRKRNDSLVSEWHFRSQCPHWPEADFVEVAFMEAREGERLCQTCAKLETNRREENE